MEKDRGGEPFAVQRGALDGLHQLTLTGELDLAAVPELTTALEEALAGPGAVLVDLSGLTFIDSAGMRALLEPLRRPELEGRLEFTRPSAAVARSFELAGMAGEIPFTDR